MILSLLRISGMFSSALFVLILLISARPHPSASFTEIFVPPNGCPMPCFLGIRPGITEGEDAVNILESHPWVDRVELDLRSGYIRWYWSDQSPPDLSPNSASQILINYRSRRVLSVSVSVNSATGSVWHTLSEQQVNGVPLTAFIQVEGPSCVTEPMNFWGGRVQRIYYTDYRAPPQTIYRPQRAYRAASACP